MQYVGEGGRERFLGYATVRSHVSTTPTAQARLLVERLPLVTYLLDAEPSSRVLFVSPQIERWFGYSRADFDADGSFWTNCIVAADRERFLAARAELREARQEMCVEYRVTASDGREIWVRDTAVVDEGEDGALYIHGYLTDLTREKALERQLADERAQADAFFRDSAVGMGITDAEGRYVRVNDALARLNDATPEEHVGRTLAEVAPATAERVSPLLARVHETGEALHQQEVTTDAGTFVVSFFPIVSETGVQYGRVIVDITDQRRAEERYRTLIEQLPLVTYINTLDPRSRATYVSPQIEEMYGYPAEEWLRDASLWDRVVHPDDLDDVAAAEQAARDRGEPFELEYRIVRADGTVRWVLDLMETIRDSDGVPLFERGFLVDVTTRRESERLFRAVFEGSLDAMLITDDEGRFVDANEAACDLLGRSREDVLALRVGDISPPQDDRPKAQREFFERGEASGSLAMLRPDGEVREVEYASRANVVPGLHLTVGRDVTERRGLERELWRAQRLESVGRLAGGVAHDFNNLLTTIRGYAQLMLSQAAPSSVERHHAAEIDRAADRAAGLTAQLLAFGRRQDLQPRPVELNRLVTALAPTLRSVAGVDVELDLDGRVPAARVDPSSVEQLLLNLVENAARVTPVGESIVVRTANAGGGPLPDDLADGDYVVLSVVDRGPGIEESVLDHVFDPFFASSPAGGDLGLSPAYGVAKQSGGTIAVTSHPGEGATFDVYLPRAGGDGAAVLALDGDPAVRDVLFEVLTEAGFRTITSPTPAEAIGLASDGDVDLLLTELDERRAAALAASLGIPHALSIQKPYAPQRLVQAVRAALGAVALSGD